MLDVHQKFFDIQLRCVHDYSTISVAFMLMLEEYLSVYWAGRISQAVSSVQFVH